MRARLARLTAILFLGLAVSACDTIEDVFSDAEEEEILAGNRISVLALESALEPDPAIAAEPVILPRPVENDLWPQQGGFPNHAMHHLAASDRLTQIWSRDVGESESDDNLVLNTPVISGSTIFLLDAESTVHAFDIASGAIRWARELIPEDEDDVASLGGGVAFSEGVVIATTAYGSVVAMNSVDGSVLWHEKLGLPIRAAPTISDGRVFVVTFNNQFYALNVLDGSVLWTHTGISESAGLLGAASPAVSGDLVIASYSSGELVALRVENGRIAWSDSLIFQGRLGGRTRLSDIDGAPVVDGGLVYAVSHSGRLVAVDLRSGRRIWEQEIASAQTPWLAGDFIFVLTIDMELVCLRRIDGRVRWVRPLPRFEDPEDREDPIVWTGPVLVSDRLVVANNLGEALAVSPYTGETIGRDELPDGIRVPPVVARETMFFYTVDAELVALR